MPNTLAHIGVQTLITRGLFKQADLRFVLLGCIIPDLPWILQRLVALLSMVDAYQLRSYAIAQAALFMCIPACIGVAVLTQQKAKTFVILLFGCVLHLLLDAMQTKWANGVHLFAPFDWSLLNFGWYWPESPITYILSALGPVMVIYYWRGLFLTPVPLHFAVKPVVLSVLFFLVYFVGPVLSMNAVWHADNHYVATLAQPEKAGKYVEIDRRPLRLDENGQATLRGIAGEDFKLDQHFENPAKVSIKGQFKSDWVLQITQVHYHQGALRDWFSYLGLLAVLMSFVVPFVYSFIVGKREQA